MGKMVLLFRWPLIAMIRFYRMAISPWLPPACRFEPTCSHFAEDALKEHGAFRGSWLTLCRLCKCHPWGASGYDPVPVQTDKKG